MTTEPTVACAWCDRDVPPTEADEYEAPPGSGLPAVFWLCRQCGGPEPAACTEHRNGCGERHEREEAIMSYFEQAIQAQIDAAREGAAAGGWDFTERTPQSHTIGDFVAAVFAVTTPEDARAFYAGYLGFLHALPPDAERSEQYTPEQVAQSNIGWCFGEGMDGDRRAMWHAVTGAAHPVFGTALPTAEEVFEAGVERGKQAWHGEQ